MNPLTIIIGDAAESLRALPEKSVNCCVTSPPYWNQRDYKHQRQIGQERTPELYIETLRAVFAEVWRVLRNDGTLWLNLSDTYSTGSSGQNGNGSTTLEGVTANSTWQEGNQYRKQFKGLPPKNLIGIPWRVALALQADGWILRSDIIWAKPNCLPESIKDRPTRSHEHIFFLSKSARYFYDHEAIKKPPSPALLKQIAEGYNGSATKDFTGSNVQDASATKSRVIDGYRKRLKKQRGHARRHNRLDNWDNLTKAEQMACGSNKRDVWTVATANYPGAHFATFSPELIKPCILAGCPPGGVVLDPFGGSGTTGATALDLGRRAILIELNPDYRPLIDERCNVTQGLQL